jgi:hypothetical protein
MPDEDISLGGPDTHIPALDDEPGQPGDEVQDTDTNTDVDNEGSTDTDAGSDADTDGNSDDADGNSDESGNDAEGDAGDPDAALLAKFAKRTGLDPNNPQQLKTLKTLVDKEKFILELQAKLNGGQKPDGSLTKFERDQQAAQLKAQQEQQNTPPADKAPAMPTVGTYNDVGAQWQSPQDAYIALNKAWGDAAETGDYRGVVATESAMYERRFDAIGMPKVEQLVEARLNKFMEQHFGAIMPSLQQQAMERSNAENSEFAFSELEGVDGYKDIRSLDQELEGPPLIVNGEQFRNTPLNRILTENPWIMSIKRENADPKVADRLTYLARLKAAHKIFSGGQISSQKAKSLVEAGSKLEQRKAQDRVRQSLNSGGTPSRSLDQGKAKPKGFIEELLDSTGGPVSFADL